MQTVTLDMDPEQARELYQEYKKDRHYSTPIDREVQRAYQLLSQGKLVVRALESIKAAGLGDDGLPKLAIVRADAPACYLRLDWEGSARFSPTEQVRGRPAAGTIILPDGTFQGVVKNRLWTTHKALTPAIPHKLRPKRALENYHVLWEAEWTPVPTRDPYLLRRIGVADMWLVVAMWDLTEVERAAIGARMQAQ